MIALREEAAPYGTTAVTRELPAEATLTALWLLGRLPAAALPWPVLRPGRAGRGPGPDVREAVLLANSGAPRCGDVEVHVRVSDYWRHGHHEDPAYDGVILHLAWVDDRLPAQRGEPVPLAGGGVAPTVAIGSALGHDVARLERLVARGPRGAEAGRVAVEPCADASSRLGAPALTALMRQQGQRRLAERAWRAARLLEREGAEGAWALLLDRALYATAGRRRESAAVHAAHLDAIAAQLGADPLAALAAAAVPARPRTLAAALQVEGVGPARALELAWNAALPLLIAVAAAYDDLALAGHTAALAAAWPAPRPYGRTQALANLLGPAASGAAPADDLEHTPARLPAGGGALYAQGLLHLQDLWCTRGGCGVCPLSRPSPPGPLSQDWGRGR